MVAKRPALSVIIISYNEEKRLPRLLRCLAKQTFRDFEVVLADNRSKDRTRTIARQANIRICDGGLPAAGRNKGAAHARAERLLFLDADVAFDKYFLANAIAEITRRKLDGATVWTRIENGRLWDKIYFGIWNGYVSLTQTFYPHAPGYCIFSTKQLHKRIKGFNEHMSLADDANYVWKLSKHGKFRVLRSTRIIT